MVYWCGVVAVVYVRGEGVLVYVSSAGAVVCQRCRAPKKREGRDCAPRANPPTR